MLLKQLIIIGSRTKRLKKWISVKIAKNNNNVIVEQLKHLARSNRRKVEMLASIKVLLKW